MSVAAILKHKGHRVISVQPATTVNDIAALLGERRIGAVLVLDEAEHLQGIVSERDIVRVIGQHGAAALDLTAADVMTREVRTATPATRVVEAMEIMTQGRFRHLPVLDYGVLIGLISIGDIVKARITEQEHEVDSLKAYVAGA